MLTWIGLALLLIYHSGVVTLTVALTWDYLRTERLYRDPAMILPMMGCILAWPILMVAFLRTGLKLNI